MDEKPVLVVVEVTSVQDAAGLKVYLEHANALIGALGGTVVGRGGTSVDGEPSFAPLAIQRWPSENSFRSWLASEAYKPLREIRLASATMRVAIIPLETEITL